MYLHKRSNSIFRAGKAVVATLTSSVVDVPANIWVTSAYAWKKGRVAVDVGASCYRLPFDSCTRVVSRSCAANLGLDRVQTLAQREKNEKRWQLSRITRAYPCTLHPYFSYVILGGGTGARATRLLPQFSFVFIYFFFSLERERVTLWLIRESRFIFMRKTVPRKFCLEKLW